MKRLKIFLALLTGVVCTYHANAQDRNLNIIPQPNHVVIRQGTITLSPKAAIVYTGFKVKPLNLDVFAKQVLKQAKGSSAATTQKLNIKIDASKVSKEEAYLLTINASGVTITARTEKGAFYALQSLTQIITNSSTAAIPYVSIEDSPRYQYRGLMLDVGRHYFPLEFIKSFIDLMAYYKLNNFHWHLTEDQGWRIEIKKYPKLATIASQRAGTLLNHLRDKERHYESVPYKGFYTQEEIKEVVRYATSKYINVIPEIELPGHSLALLSAYPELACGENPGPFKAATRWGVFEEIMCAGKEDTFKFLENVFDEVLTLFPSKYIHIGGDEAPKKQWKLCKFCQQRIKDNNLKDEHELQSYFIKRIEKYLNSKGRRIIGWDEILQGGLAPDATVMGWRGVRYGIQAAKQGNDVIMVPSSHLYLDHRESISTEEPLTISTGTRHSSLNKVYNFNPSIDTLSADVQKHIIGVQANLWTEYVTNEQKVYYLILPRVLGLAEIAWTDLANKNWDRFSRENAATHLGKIDASGKMYRVPEVLGIESQTYEGGDFEIELFPPVKGAKIYYNLNNRPVTEMDRVYDGKIKIKVPKGQDRILKTMVVTPSGKRSVTTTSILNNKPPKEEPKKPTI